MARPFEGKILKCIFCNKEYKRSQSEIKRGRISYCSMSCYGKDHRGDKSPSFKHGYTIGKKTPEYLTWVSMLDRCYTKSSSTYKKYGAKKIGVCNRWRFDFKNFLSDMGPKPTPHHSIDRIDGSKDYYPENCRWATSLEQANNQKSNVVVEWNGDKYTVSQLMRKLGIYTKSGVYYSRIKRGWSMDKTFKTLA